MDTETVSFPALIADELDLYRIVSFYIDTKGPLFDGQGSERTVTNSSQTVTGTLTLDGFGNTIASTGSSSNPYMYAATSGYRNDGDAGLSYVRTRYYDAQVGRFTSRDTLLNQKPYLYCDHDPINYVDPSGHVGVSHGGSYIDWHPHPPNPLERVIAPPFYWILIRSEYMWKEAILGGVVGLATGGVPGAVEGGVLGGIAGLVLGKEVDQIVDAMIHPKPISY